MAEGKVVETIYGKHHKFEIVKKPGPGYAPSRFVIYKDGKSSGRGYFDSLSDAVEAARKEG